MENESNQKYHSMKENLEETIEALREEFKNL